MERPDIFPKLTPANFKWPLLFLVCIIFLSAKEAWALPFYTDFMPQSYSLEVESAPLYTYLSDCYNGNGRAFSFTSSFTLRISGVSFFFYKDGSAGATSVYKSEDLAVSLYLGDNPNPEQAMVFRSTFRNSYPSHNAVVSSFGVSSARGLLFELAPVWLESGKQYTFVVECFDASVSPQKIYGGSGQTDVRSFDSQTLTTSAGSNIRKPYFQLYSKNDGLTKVKPAAKTPPTNRPVVFVHGLGGLPSDFSDYTDTLKNSGWDSRYLLSFDYGLKDGQYNNFASISDELPRLSVAVATLSAMYKNDGGDGKVNLVGYSSGAPLAKNFLGNFKASHHVENFISIAGDFKGSFLADLEAGSDFPRAASEATANLAKIFSPGISSFNPLTYGRTPRDTVFKTQIISTSSQVSSFKKEDLPDGIKYYSLQGDIKAASTQKLFKSLVKSEGSLGDGAVLGSSTNDLPNVSSFSFLDSAIATRSVTRSAATVSASFTLPDFSKIKFFHSNLLKAVEIKNKILELLR